MATRFNANSGPGGLPSGYQGLIADYEVPSSGIEDVDRAIFDTFDKEINFQVGATKEEIKKTPVIFASGEKWALLKRGTALRDRNGTLILPLITIARADVSQDLSKDIVGRGINQQTGNIVIKRRLHTSDRGYQNTFNRFGLKNQSSVAASPPADSSGFSTSRPDVGDLLSQDDVAVGAFMQPPDGKHVYEIISIPSPQFFNVKYEITFWTQYTQHMNQMIEKLMSSYLPQGNALKLETSKGYWYIATVDNNSFSSDSNFDDMSSEERIIRCKFSVTVNAYLVASAAPGVPAAARSYVSAPVISFDVVTEQELDAEGDTDFYLGVDDPTLPLDDKQPGRLKSLQRNLINSDTPNDPALQKLKREESPLQFKEISYIDPITGKQKKKTVKINVVNKRTGESVISNATDLNAFILGIRNS